MKECGIVNIVYRFPSVAEPRLILQSCDTSTAAWYSSLHQARSVVLQCVRSVDELLILVGVKWWKIRRRRVE